MPIGPVTDAVTTRPSPFRATSGWIPLLMSGAATALVVGYLATGPHEPTLALDNGVLRPDESPMARLWQLLMVLQLPAIAFFAVSWLPRDPRRTTAMMTLQALAIVIAATPVFLLES